MPQVSRRPLSREAEEKIYTSFYKAIGLIGEDEARLFVGDLLTRTERIMLPKRLAIAILLTRGENYNSIRDALKVTQTTIASVSKTLELSEGLRKAIKKLEKSETWRSWWQDVESLLYRLSSPGKVFIDEEAISRRRKKLRKL